MTQIELEDFAREGTRALNAGQPEAARDAFLAIANAGRATPKLWALIAEACDQLGDSDTQHRALDAILAADPRDILALVMKGDLFSKAGDDRAAIGWYNSALSQAEVAGSLSPALSTRLEQASRAATAAAARFEGHLHQTVSAARPDAPLPPRFEESLAILTGRQPVQLQQPTSFYYPGLPQTAFYDTTLFDWVPALEAAYPQILAEVEAVMADPTGIAPYVQGDPGRPNLGHALLNDARWSAYHFFEQGQPVPAHVARCPVTAATLDHVPLPRIAQRSPMALFSILGPKTHIPPHTGMLNTRLICHLPLIVPEGCRLRVGNHSRTVEPGKVLIFDDSVQHEAWNDSDAVRVILLFEIWRPELDPAEKAALTTLFEAVNLYPSSAA